MALPVYTDVAALAPFTPLLQLDPSRPIVSDTVGLNKEFENNNPKPAPGVTVNGFQRASFTVSTHSGSQFEFLAGEHIFSFDRIRTLTLGSVDEWILQTTDDSLYYAHPFHIHVNPFQTWRTGPDGKPELIWKDTILVPMGNPQYIFTQYTDYIGQFVYHCHILDHEDGGMMELLEIAP
jgi:FtsP/CotA-like multicopper oxidase with cupredoxin domain